MKYTVTITSQGQLSLPAKIRKDLGFSKTNRAIVSVKDNKVILEPVKELLSLRGSVKTSIKGNSGQIREAFEKYLAQKDIKK